MFDLFTNPKEYVENNIILTKLMIDNLTKLKETMIENQANIIDAYIQITKDCYKDILYKQMWQGYESLLDVDKNLEQAKSDLKELNRIMKGFE